MGQDAGPRCDRRAEAGSHRHRPISMATQSEPVADGVAPYAIENVIPGSTLVEDACETICALFLMASIVLIAAEAIARNVFATSFQITDEVCGYLLVALTFLSMSVAEAHGAFHRVEMVQSRLSRAGRLVTQLLFDLMSLLASALVTWQLYRLTINSWHSDDVAPTPLHTPLWLPQ